MEEQKIKTANAEEKKYTYEELTNICNKLLQEREYLQQQLQQASASLRTIDRLDYLIRIVEADKTTGNWHFDPNFMEKCIQEIQEIMTPPVDEKETKEEN